MDKNIEKFLEYLKTSHYTDTQVFGNHFNQAKMDVVLKITNDAKSIDEEEWDSILSTYETDLVVNHAIMLSDSVPSYAKSCVVATLISSKLTGAPFGYEKGFVKEILTNFPDIEDFQLESLYNNFHNEVMQPISHPAHNEYDPEISQETIDRLVKLELDVYNGKSSKPSGYRDKQHCFSHIKSEEMYEYLLENMPSDSGLAEKVATAIINNPSISNDKKNQVFEKYGCNPDALVKSTPEISNVIYESAIYSAYDMADPHMSGYTYHMVVSRARNLLDSMIRYGLLSEALEYDLVSRAIDDAKQSKTKKMNDMLRTIMHTTTSPKVLHLIYSTAPHINDRDDACNNEYMSETDLKAQAKLYCDKIEKKAKVGKTSEVADKWIIEVIKMMNRVPLDDYQYGVLMQVNPTSTVASVLSSDKTPDHIIDKVIDVLKRMEEEDKAPIWTELHVKAEIAKGVRSAGFTDDKHADYAQNAFSATSRNFESNGTCERSYLGTRIITKNPEFGKQLSGIIKDAIAKANWLPKNGVISDYEKEMDKYFNSLLETKEKESGPKPLHEMKYHEIISAQDNLVNEMSKYIRRNMIEQYTELQKIADRHVELANEYDTRDIAAEARDTLGL